MQPSAPPATVIESTPQVSEPLTETVSEPVSDPVAPPTPPAEPRPAVEDIVIPAVEVTSKFTPTPTTEPLFPSEESQVAKPVDVPTPEPVPPVTVSTLEVAQGSGVKAQPEAEVVKPVLDDLPVSQGTTATPQDAGFNQPGHTPSSGEAATNALDGHGTADRRKKMTIIIGAIVALVLCIAAGLAYFFLAPKNAKTVETPPEPTITVPAATEAVAPAPEVVVPAVTQPEKDAVAREETSPVTPLIAQEPEQTAAEKAAAEKAAAAKAAAAKAAKEKAAAEKAAKKKEAELQRIQEQARKDQAAQAQRSAAAAAAAAKAAPQRSCSDAFFLSRPLCVIEGPKTFWKCSPDGQNWDNSIPGCARQSQ